MFTAIKRATGYSLIILPCNFPQLTGLHSRGVPGFTTGLPVRVLLALLSPSHASRLGEASITVKLGQWSRYHAWYPNADRSWFLRTPIWRASLLWVRHERNDRLQCHIVFECCCFERRNGWVRCNGCSCTIIAYLLGESAEPCP